MSPARTTPARYAEQWKIPDIQIRVYQTQVDDAGTMRWLAEAGEPTSIGDGWIVFAETRVSEPTERAAVEALYGILYRRYWTIVRAQRRLGAWLAQRRWNAFAERLRRLFPGGKRP